ncbi:unnamed protein product [Paramecium octaurelia]|uniref:Uncharacterized protein n=1 Tax=Paramecium octaurelia TaxID=43137 RepID=A0A8S1TVS3_PAROT|nr:unnamed protein product [Paramecium octaurelia]
MNTNTKQGINGDMNYVLDDKNQIVRGLNRDDIYKEISYKIQDTINNQIYDQYCKQIQDKQGLSRL